MNGFICNLDFSCVYFQAEFRNFFKKAITYCNAGLFCNNTCNHHQYLLKTPNLKKWTYAFVFLSKIFFAKVSNNTVLFITCVLSYLRTQ